MRRFTFLLFSLCACDVFAQVTFKTIYGSQQFDQPVAIEKNHNGGYAVAGYTEAHDPAGNFQLFVTDSAGDTLWSKEYGYGAERLADMKCTNDGGYILCGYGVETSVPANSWDLYMVKTDSAGNVQWTKNYMFQGLNNEYPRAVMQTADGGYAVTGTIDSIGDTRYGFILKVDASGALQWMKKYECASWYSGFNCIAQVPATGELIVAGVAADTYMSTVVMKVDTAGVLQWLHRLATPNVHTPQTLLITAAGDVYMGGTYNLPNYNGQRIFLMKLDALSGVPGWGFHYDIAMQRTLFGEMIFSDGGGLCIAGETSMGSTEQGVLFETDFAGTPTSAFNYIQHGAGRYVAVAPGVDGGYAVLSAIDSAFGVQDSSSYLLIKTTSNMSAQCGINVYGAGGESFFCVDGITQLISEDNGGETYLPGAWVASGLDVVIACPLVGVEERSLSDVLVYPNPAEDVCNIETPGANNGTVIFYNALGEIVRRENISSDRMMVSLADFSSGVYFIHIITNGTTQVHRLVKK